MGIFGAVCNSTARLDGKTVVITGCNTGIGKCNVKDFYQRGARVIMACRNVQKAQETADEIKNTCDAKVGEIIIEELDLGNLKSIRKCANSILSKEPRINILVNNAGVMACPEGKTDDGFETQFGTNHLGHFLFTLLLLPRICESKPARIVNVSSLGHQRGVMDFDDLNWNKRPYVALQAYGQSKLANVLFTKELAKRLKEAKIDGVTTYSLHPGVVNTELARHLTNTWVRDILSRIALGLFGWAIKTPEQGAQTTMYCAVAEECANESGLYYAECAEKEPSQAAQNEEDAKRLWTESLKLVGLPENYDPLKGLKK